MLGQAPRGREGAAPVGPPTCQRLSRPQMGLTLPCRTSLPGRNGSASSLTSAATGLPPCTSRPTLPAPEPSLGLSLRPLTLGKCRGPAGGRRSVHSSGPTPPSLVLRTPQAPHPPLPGRGEGGPPAAAAWGSCRPEWFCNNARRALSTTPRQGLPAGPPTPVQRCRVRLCPPPDCGAP